MGWLSRRARLWQNCGLDELSWERVRMANTTSGEEVLDGGGGGAERRKRERMMASIRL